MYPRPAGMSDSDSDGDDDLYELGVMTDEECRTSTMSATDYGYVYNITFPSGFRHQLLFMTSFWIMFQFQHLSEEHSIDLLRRELVACANQQSLRSVKRLD